MSDNATRTSPGTTGPTQKCSKGRKRVCGMRVGVLAAIVGVFVATAIALGVGLGVGLNQHNRQNGKVETLQQHLLDVTKKYNLPAVGLVVNTGNSTVSRIAAAGVRKIGTDVQATTNDIWHFGSCTKAMTAAVVALLVQKESLAWNSTLRELIGASEGGRNMLDVYQNVTVEMLSSHTSGIRDSALTPTILMTLTGLDAVKGRVVATNLTLSTAPVSPSTLGNFTYANLNYVILGLIIDVVARNVTAEEVIQSSLWAPLGMSSAGWGPNPEPNTQSTNNPYPHLPNGTLGKAGLPTPLPEDLPMSSRDNPPALNTAGRAHMRLSDFDAWLQLHVNTTIQQSVGLSPGSMTKLHEIAPGTGYYTYGGWGRVVENGGGYILNHDGSNAVNYATAWIETQKGWSVAVTTNVGGEPNPGSTWVDGTHGVAEDVLTGKLSLN